MCEMERERERERESNYLKGELNRRCKLASKCGNVQTFSFAGFTR